MTGAADGNLSGGGTTWAITAYWNPMRYRLRRDNYRLFREGLGLPLLAVELAYDDAFELGPSDADILLRRLGHDLLWQKERLLNVALAALPDDCRTVAWVDCDVLFETDDWVERTERALAEHPLVQLFGEVHRMPAAWRPGMPYPDGVDVRRSIPALIAAGVSVEDCLAGPAEQTGCSHGHAWAARRDLLGRHGLYDSCVVGGGDAVLARAAYGRIDDAVRLHVMGSARGEHYRAWAGPFYGDVRGSVGFVGGRLMHLWHGTLENRQYRQRQEQLSRYDFDPAVDIRLDENDAWRWNSNKPELHGFVRGYFASRMEDG